MPGKPGIFVFACSNAPVPWGSVEEPRSDRNSECDGANHSANPASHAEVRSLQLPFPSFSADWRGFVTRDRAYTPYRVSTNLHQFVTLTVLVAGAMSAAGDTVTLRDKPPFRNVQIIDVRRGKLVFRGVSGETIQKPMSMVEWVEIDAMPRFSTLEKAMAAGQWETALAEIAALEREAREPWLQTLLRHRRLRILEFADRLDEAVATFLELARSDPQTPAALLPQKLGPAGSHKNRAALDLLRKTKLRGVAADLDEGIDRLRLQLTLLEEPENLARDFAPLKSAAPASASTAVDEEEGGFLFGGPNRKGPVRQVSLSSQCGLLDECDRLLTTGNAAAVQSILEAANPYVAAADNGPWRITAARCAMARQQFARAADELLALAAEFEKRNPAWNAAALYYVAVAHEGLNRPEVAADVYKELSGRPNLPAEVRGQVEAALSRLKGEK